MTNTARNNTLGAAIAVRGGIGGLLMGLANLVPGLSGGTMLLAVGVYPQVVRSVAEVSTFRFRAKSLLLLACVIGAALLAIASLAGAVKDLVIDHRWIMYSLFIGLTLGGAPILWRMLRPVNVSAVVATVVGLLAIVGLVLSQSSSAPTGAPDDTRHILMLVLAGAAGGAAMILPGVSGGYLLLILGQYVVILTAIDSASQAVTGRDWALLGEAMWVLVPVASGVLVGVVGVSNLVKFLLDRFPKATIGFLLGLLIGAVVGLWPFQRPVSPNIGDTLQGRIVTEQNLGSFAAEDWTTTFFSPSLAQGLGALGLIAAGFVICTAIAQIGTKADQNGSN